jgi:putative tryptophan/tyrosine transport system substrate-binding protein
VVGFLNSASAVGYASMAPAFKHGLSETGYVDGNNVAIEYRWADDQYDRLPALATDLVSRRVTVIFANSPSIAAAKAATSTIPIIMMSGDDPVRLGFVTSFNRPGGNITGVSILSGELAAKRLELLRELVPQAKTIAILINSDFGPSGRFRSDVEVAARARSRLNFYRRTTNVRLITLSIAWLNLEPTHFWSGLARFWTADAISWWRSLQRWRFLRDMKPAQLRLQAV